MKFDAFKSAGLAGLILVIAAALIYGARGVPDLYTWIPLGTGIAAVLLWLSRDWQEALETIQSRKARFGANALVLLVAVLALFGFTQAIVSNHDISWDLSKNQVNTLSDQTVKAVKNLEEDILLYHFNLGANTAPYQEFLKKIKNLNPVKFKYEMVDLNKRPLLAQTYAVRTAGTSVLVLGDRHESFTGTKEEDLVNALLKVTSSGTKVVYTLVGHKEVSMADAQNGGGNFKRSMENGSFLVKELNLTQVKTVPADAAAVLLPGPQTDLLDAELERLRRYLFLGGQVLVALDPRVPAPKLKAFVEKAGAKLEDDLVIDPLAVLSGAQPIMPPSGDFDRSHPVTKDMVGGQILVPITRSLSLIQPAPAGVRGTVLARSSRNSWVYTGIKNRIPSQPGPKDKPGPVALALSLDVPGAIFKLETEDAQDAGAAKVIVLGTSRMIANAGFGYFNNADFILNSVRWLTGEEKKISIAPKDPGNTPITMDQSQFRTVVFTVLLIIPAFCLLAGIVVALRRRRILA